MTKTERAAVEEMVLDVVAGAGGVTISELAEAMVTAGSPLRHPEQAARYHLEKLVKRGLVVKKPALSSNANLYLPKEAA